MDYYTTNKIFFTIIQFCCMFVNSVCFLCLLFDLSSVDNKVVINLANILFNFISVCLSYVDFVSGI